MLMLCNTVNEIEKKIIIRKHFVQCCEFKEDSPIAQMKKKKNPLDKTEKGKEEKGRGRRREAIKQTRRWKSLC